MLTPIRHARYHRYPHYHWGAAICDLLGRVELDDEATILDAPCGDGAISFWLIKRKIGRHYELLDISQRETDRASRLQQWKPRPLEVSASCGDISRIDVSRSTNDVWLVINSLYLLPDIDALLDRMRPRMKYIVGLFPYVNTVQYRSFDDRKPGTNINAMDREQTIAFFDRHGYSLCETKDTTYFAFNRIKSLRIRKCVLCVLNPLEYFVPRENAYYWVGLFSRRKA